MSNSFQTLSAMIAVAVLVTGCAGSGGPAPVQETSAGPSSTTSSEPGRASLFINLTSNDPHRVNMALKFGGDQLDRGHPLTILLNDKGVFVGSTKLAKTYAQQQTTLTALKGKGAKLLMCPMCAGHYQIPEADWLTVLDKSNPDLSGSLLFAPDVRSMTW